MPKNRPPKTELPPLLRFMLWIGRPMGVAFVPQNHVQVVYRMGKYAGCKGAGLIYYNKLTETLGPLVDIGGQVKEYELDNVISRDVVPVKMNVSATVAYDPEEGHELASVLTRVPKEAYTSIAGTYIRWAVLAIANQYDAAELTRYDVRAQIEEAVRDKVNEEQKFLGLKLKGKLRITRVELPARLAARHELIAQRRANILAGTEFHPAEFRRSLVSEVIEHLAHSGENESFVNFSEMLEAYTAEHKAEQLPPPPNIIDVTPTALEDKGPPPVEPPAPPPSRREEKPRPPRRKSRL